MRTVLIIQARLGSKRFPSKVIYPLSGRPILEWILRRVEGTEGIDEIVVAIPDAISDHQLASYISKLGFPVFCGDENNLIERYFSCAKVHKADVILRLPADNPFPDKEEYTRLINLFEESQRDRQKLDFASNITNFWGNGYPDGVGIEIFSMESLEQLRSRDDLSVTQKEHLATNFFDYATQQAPDEEIKVGTIKCPESKSAPGLVLDINYVEDVQRIEIMLDEIGVQGFGVRTEDFVSWYREKR